MYHDLEDTEVQRQRYVHLIASSWIITSEALRYGACSQGSHSFRPTCTVHTHTFIHNRNEPYCLCLPGYSWYSSFTDPGGIEGHSLWFTKRRSCV